MIWWNASKELNTFQRMINQILCGTEMFAAAYLDDIVIFSESCKHHLEHLKEVLKWIKADNSSR